MDNNNKLNISESEWKVMQVLWKQSPLTLGEISKKLGDRVTWNKSTINTLLRRLIKKGAASFDEARYYRYYPLVDEKKCLKEEMNKILEYLFYSSPKKLMVTLIENENFNNDDILQIEELLKSIKEKNQLK